LRIRSFSTFLAMAIIAGLPSITSAASISINAVAGIAQTTTQVEDTTYGDDMGGMVVRATVRTSGGSTTTLTGVWGDVGLGLGGVNFNNAFGDDFAMAVWGDTYTDGIWGLDFRLSGSNYTLQNLEFQGQPGNVVFDRYHGGATGTSGSSLGRDFSGFDNWGGNITATYSNAVGLNGNDPLGDLFTNFALAFGGLGLPESSQLFGTGAYRFTLDTDNARTSEQPQQPQPVPEPATMMMTAAGLGLIARMARKRKSAA
jgi:hypothetical protein